MSWKSLVTASLLCALASPAFAAPSVSISSGGLDPSTGQFIWNVEITPTAAATPLAAELGFKQTVGGGLKSVANAAPATWDTNTPGNQIFTWETSYGSPAKPEGIEANCTGCTISNTASLGGTASTVVAGALNEIFSALGSIDLPSGSATQYLTIKTAGPTDLSLTSTIALSGAYDGANLSGRVSELDTPTTSKNYKGFTGSATRTIKNGDTNLDGVVNLTDLNTLGTNYNQSGKNWLTADYTGDGLVNLSDLNVLGSNYNQSGGSLSNLTAVGVLDTPGAGSGSGLSSGNVPEPATVALVGLGLLGGLGVFRRKR